MCVCVCLFIFFLQLIFENNNNNNEMHLIGKMNKFIENVENDIVKVLSLNIYVDVEHNWSGKQREFDVFIKN